MRAMQNAVAWYAAVVSTASLFVAFLAWRSGGPRLKVRALLVRGVEDESGFFAVYVDNRGRSDVSISSIYVWVSVPDSAASPLAERTAVPVGFKLEGPELTHRLLAHSSAIWSGGPTYLDEAMGRSFRRGDRASVFVSTGYGIASTKVRVPRVGMPRFVQLFEAWERWTDRVSERIDAKLK
jgi:hypothetical protein